jgi:hypothetical protein
MIASNICLDFRQTTCTSLETQIPLSIMMSIQQSVPVSWNYNDDCNSICVVYNDDFLRISTSRASADFEAQVLRITLIFFGRPIRTFRQESSIDPGTIILYREWKGDVCSEIKKMILEDYDCENNSEYIH